MSGSQPAGPSEGLPFYRLLMVIGSLLPLFVLLALRGVPIIDKEPLIPDAYFKAICGAFAVLPTCFILFRLLVAYRTNDSKDISVGSATDNRQNLVAYLFALVIPLYQNSYTTMGDVQAALFLLAVVVFVLYHLDLYYMNLGFALCGYRVYTVEAPPDGNPLSGRHPFVVFSRKRYLTTGTTVRCYRISDIVYIEK